MKPPTTKCAVPLFLWLAFDVRLLATGMPFHCPFHWTLPSPLPLAQEEHSQWTTIKWNSTCLSTLFAQFCSHESRDLTAQHTHTFCKESGRTSQIKEMNQAYKAKLKGKATTRTPKDNGTPEVNYTRKREKKKSRNSKRESVKTQPLLPNHTQDKEKKASHTQRSEWNTKTNENKQRTETCG